MFRRIFLYDPTKISSSCFVLVESSFGLVIECRWMCVCVVKSYVLQVVCVYQSEVDFVKEDSPCEFLQQPNIYTKKKESAAAHLQSSCPSNISVVSVSSR